MEGSIICVICSRFISKKSWLEHLMGTGHLERARSKLEKQWKLEETRNCLIVVCSEQPVAITDRILQYFSNPVHRAFVSDFIWWAEKPEIGFVQFESRKILKNVMRKTVDFGRNSEGKVFIHGQTIEVRRGESYSDTQWAELLDLIMNNRTRNETLTCLAAAGSSTNISEFAEEYEDEDGCIVLDWCNSSHPSNPHDDSTRRRSSDMSDQDIILVEEEEDFVGEVIDYGNLTAPTVHDNFDGRRTSKSNSLLNRDVEMPFSSTSVETPSFYLMNQKQRDEPCSSLQFQRNNKDRENRLEDRRTPNSLINRNVEMPSSSKSIRVNAPWSIKTNQQQKQQLRSNFQYKNDREAEFFTTFFDLIRREVEIPYQEFRLALNLIRHLNKMFSNEDTGEKPAFLFRNWGFQLRYHSHGYHNPLVFVRNRKMEKVNNRVFQQLILRGTPSIEVCTPVNLANEAAVRKFDNSVSADYTVNLTEPQPYKSQISTHFSLFTHVGISMEAQLWRLAKYLCSFDSRSQRLMEVAFYWAGINKIEVGVEKVTVKGEILNFTPGPAALTWMVVFFLCHEKIIPTPGTVLDREHRPALYSLFGSNASSEKIDIGFDESDSFKEKWQKNVQEERKQNDDSLLALVLLLFRFWGRLSKDCWVIDTREGKYYSPHEFIGLDFKESKSRYHENLKRLQVDLYDLYENKISRFEEAKRLGIQETIHFANPFCPTRNILIRKRVLPHFQKTFQSLNWHLEGLKRDRGVNGKRLEIYDIQRLFTIEGLQ